MRPASRSTNIGVRGHEALAGGGSERITALGLSEAAAALLSALVQWEVRMPAPALGNRLGSLTDARDAPVSDLRHGQHQQQEEMS